MVAVRPLYSAKPLCVKCVFGKSAEVQKFCVAQAGFLKYNLFID
jgi:hypothetical protein